MDLFRLLWQSITSRSMGGGGAATTAYSDAVLALAPTAYWRLGEASGSLADSSGNGHTLTATGLTYSTTGWATDGNAACTWGGSGSYATAADHADWDVGTSDFSIAFVLKRSGTPADAEDILCHDFQGYGSSWGVGLTSGAGILRVHAGNDYNLFHSASGTIYDNNLHHIVVTFDRSANATMYFDGSSVGTVDISADVSTDLTNTRPVWLGATDSAQENLTGTLDEVAFWKSTLLSSGQVSTLYAAR